MIGFKKYLKSYQEELINERQSSFDGGIIEAIHKLMKKGITEFTSNMIVSEGGFTDKIGKPMSPRSLSARLKSLGFKKGELKRREGSPQRFIPIDKQHLSNLFKRYGFDDEFLSEIKQSSQSNL